MEGWIIIRLMTALGGTLGQSGPAVAKKSPSDHPQLKEHPSAIHVPLQPHNFLIMKPAIRPVYPEEVINVMYSLAQAADLMATDSQSPRRQPRKYPRKARKAKTMTLKKYQPGKASRG